MRKPGKALNSLSAIGPVNITFVLWLALAVGAVPSSMASDAAAASQRPGVTLSAGTSERFATAKADARRGNWPAALRGFEAAWREAPLNEDVVYYLALAKDNLSRKHGGQELVVSAWYMSALAITQHKARAKQIVDRVAMLFVTAAEKNENLIKVIREATDKLRRGRKLKAFEKWDRVILDAQLNTLQFSRARETAIRLGDKTLAAGLKKDIESLQRAVSGERRLPQSFESGKKKLKPGDYRKLPWMHESWSTWMEKPGDQPSIRKAVGLIYTGEYTEARRHIMNIPAPKTRSVGWATIAAALARKGEVQKAWDAVSQIPAQGVIRLIAARDLALADNQVLNAEGLDWAVFAMTLENRSTIANFREYRNWLPKDYTEAYLDGLAKAASDCIHAIGAFRFKRHEWQFRRIVKMVVEKRNAPLPRQN